MDKMESGPAAEATATEEDLRHTLVKHVAVALLGAAFAWAFWETRPEWDGEMRLWRAIGDASFMLLLATLAIGPLIRLWPRHARLLPWRRPLGIWFALFAAIHAYLVWDGWARWDLGRLFGFEDIPSARDGPLLVEPGFGLANLIGLVALLFALVLLATSSDRALRLIGPTAWKRIQRSVHVIFHLIVLHTAYFLFLHYEPSLASMVFRKNVPPPNWFQVPFLLLVAIVLLLQFAALIKDVRERR